MHHRYFHFPLFFFFFSSFIPFITTIAVTPETDVIYQVGKAKNEQREKKIEKPLDIYRASRKHCKKHAVATAETEE